EQKHAAKQRSGLKPAENGQQIAEPAHVGLRSREIRQCNGAIWEESREHPVDQVQTYRPLLFSIAYRMTGYASQAEDIVQDAYLRYQQADQAAIRSPKSYLTAIVTNLSLNYLKSAQRVREDYMGIWLPEPILTSLPAGQSPEEQYEQQESTSIAFLVLL